MSVVGKLLKRSGLLKAQAGDVLVVRYGGRANAADAERFVEGLIAGLRALPAEDRKSVPKIPIVITAKGVDWSLERKP